MHFGRKGWLIVLGCAAAVTAGYFGLDSYRHRFVHTDDDLLRLLPSGQQATVFFANVAGLRQAGYLRLLNGTRRVQEKDYTDFIRQTGFDYTTDLDAMAGARDPEELFLALRGRFHWSAICSYLRTHGGSCSGNSGRMVTSTPGKRASIHSLQPDVITVAIGANAEQEIHPQQAAAPPSAAPVWVRPAHDLLSNPSDLPLALRIFAISLQSADSVVVALEPADGNGTDFQIAVNAVFENSSMAETARKQLVLNTNMLKLELAREKKQPDPSDLAWLLISGTFEVRNQRLAGTWPVRQELVRSLQ